MCSFLVFKVHLCLSTGVDDAIKLPTYQGYTKETLEVNYCLKRFLKYFQFYINKVNGKFIESYLREVFSLSGNMEML